MFHNKGHERFVLLGLASGGDRLLNERVVIAIMKYSVIVLKVGSGVGMDFVVMLVVTCTGVIFIFNQLHAARRAMAADPPLPKKR